MSRKLLTASTGAACAAPLDGEGRPHSCLDIDERDESTGDSHGVLADPSNLPHWHTRLHLFDGLEISPCVTINDRDSQTWIEVCHDPAKAEFWSVYGHYNSALCGGFGGVDCLADFATETDARAFADELCRLHPHLRGQEGL